MTKNNGFSPVEMKIKITLTDPQLGTTSNNPELRREYIMGKNPSGIDEAEDEGFNVDEELDKAMTVFPRDEKGRPYIWDYMIRGFFKDAQGGLNRVTGMKMAAFKRIIDGVIFVKERKVPMILPKGGKVTHCTRPLRTSGPTGERVALACSEQVPAGTTMELTIQVLESKYLDDVRRWLDYGKFKGLGQWRNSGKGRFEWEELIDKKASKTPKKKIITTGKKAKKVKKK